MKNKNILWLAIILLIAGCATYDSNTDERTIGELTTQERSYDHSYEEVYNAAIQALAQYQWRITHSDKESQIIQAKSNQDLFSITFKSLENSTDVRVKNESLRRVARADIANFLDNISEYLNQ